jgi:flagellar hook protein FlgE
MYNGVSGLSAEQQWMDTIGNNIANVNTTGYKAATVSFEDQLSQTLQGASQANSNVGGTNPIQIGLGVKIGAIGMNTAQGGLQATSKPTDMAISGNGYFMLGDGGAVKYSRDGTFALDNQGNLVSSSTGAYVLGWPADSTGKIDSTQQISAAAHLQIPVGSLTVTNPTANATFSGNLSVDTPPSTNPTGTYTRSVNVYDSLGEKQPVTLTFNNLGATPPAPTAVTASTTGGTLATGSYNIAYTYVYPGGESASYAAPATSVTGPTGSVSLTGMTLPTGATGYNVYVNGTKVTASPQTSATYNVTTSSGSGSLPTAPVNQWVWSASGGTGATATVGGSGTVNFTNTGTTTSTGAITLNPNTDGSKVPQSIALNFANVTQVAGQSTAAPSSQDGSSPGTLQSFNVDSTGTITGIFSNGATRALGQVALANFQNPGGLNRDGNNEFTESPNSGTAEVGTANSNGLGTLATGFVEQSNVDLSNEFTHMIVSQRGFEANTKIISTVDTLLSDVIHIVQ